MPDIQADATRQTRLERRWAHYKGRQYDHREYTWDKRHLPEDTDVHQYEAGQMVSPSICPVTLQQRRPWVQYRLIHTIVSALTGRLFSPRANPNITHDDPLLAAAAEQLARHTTLMNAFKAARTFGGGQGTAVLAVSLISGRITFEALDPRHLYPRWQDRLNWELEQVEIRYKYDQNVIREGRERVVTFWFRRVIDATHDITYKPVEVDESGKLPTRWVEDKDRSYLHGLGRCPVAWTQNLPCPDELDGEHDGEGVEGLQAAIDELLSQAHKGTRVNCDPTVIVKSSGDGFKEITTGADVTLKVDMHDDVELLEQSGTGTTTAIALVTHFRKLALEVAQCVLDDPSLGDRATATEVLRSDSPMRLKCDTLRDQYGRWLILPVVNITLQLVWTALSTPFQDLDGAVKLDSRGIPIAKVIRMRDARVVEAITKAQRQADVLEKQDFVVVWPPYGDPVLDETHKATDATRLAREAGLIDRDSAVRFLAPYFRIADTEALLAVLASVPDPIEVAAAAAAKEAKDGKPSPKD